MRGVYIVKFSGTVTTAKTLLQVKVGAAISMELLYASITNKSNDASDSSSVEILRKTVAATVTSQTPLLTTVGDQAAKSVGGTAATGDTATAEGTNGDILVDEGFNVLNGWVWMPTPETLIEVPAAGLLALKIGTDIASATIKGMMIFKEIG